MLVPSIFRSDFSSLRALLVMMLVIGLTLLSISPAQANYPEARSHADQRLTARFMWLDDPEEPLELQQVINRLEHDAFKPLDGSLGRGYTLSNSWLSLKLTDSELNSFDYLWMSPSQLNEVDVYFQTGIDAKDADSYQKVALGDHTSSAEKPYIHFRMLFPLKSIRSYQAYPAFRALGEYQIFIRVRTNSAHSLNAVLLTDEAMVSDSNKYLFFYAGFTTISFILAAFSLFVAYRLRDKVYFWYAFYLLTIMASYMPITGIFFVVFEHAPAYLSDVFSGAGTGLGFLCFSMLCIYLLSDGSRTLNSWVKGYLQLTAVLGLIMAITSPFDIYAYLGQIVGINAILFSTTLMVCFALRLKGGTAGDWFVFSALFLTAAGVFINFSRLLGWLPENIFTIHIFQFTSLLHMLLLNQAFAERVMSAEKKALKAAQVSEQRAKEMAAGMNHELIKVLDQEKSLRIEQERFIDMISHEYRTPLSILKTNLEILELKEKPDWTGRHNLHVMQQASERLQEVFDKTIKGASWKQALEHRHEQKELVSLLDHFMDEAHVMWNNIRMNYTVNAQHAWYKSLDAALMKTVVFNLIDNARKYSSDPFAIQVSLTETDDGKGLIFSVKNPVAGVVGKSGKELTEKYTRGGNSAGTSGLGLGLNLVEQIVDQLGDQIDLIESNNTFEARISLSAEAAPEEALSSFENGHKPDGSFV